MNFTKDTLRQLIAEEIQNYLSEQGEEEPYRASPEEMKRKLSRVLISQYGGQGEKAVNELRSNPLTKAKITTAIDSIISESL